MFDQIPETNPRKRHTRSSIPGDATARARRRRPLRLAFALLGVCVGIGAIASPAAAAPGDKKYTARFDCVGFPQQFSVPAGVTSLEFTAAGAGGSGPRDDRPGGAGAEIRGTLNVAFGDVLTITVGCTPALDPNGRFSEQLEQRKVGGYGFSPGGSSEAGAAGGGATGIGLCDGCAGAAVLVAGGGGGGGFRAGVVGSNRRTGYGGAGDNFGGSGTGSGGGAPGGNATANGGNGGEGGGGGGGFPSGGGAGGDTSGAPDSVGGGGGGGLSYQDPTRVTLVRQRVNNKVEDGSVTLSFRGPDGLGVPETFVCTGRSVRYVPPASANLLRVTVIGANGGSTPRAVGRTAASGGLGAAVSAFVITQSALSVAVGCPGAAGELSRYARETAPGGAGGFGIVAGGSGGTGNHNALSSVDLSAYGGAGGGGASGISFAGSTVPTVRLIAGGGGGGGGTGGDGGFFTGLNPGGDGGKAGPYQGPGGTAGAPGTGTFGPGAGGAFGSGGPGQAIGGNSAPYIGSLCGGGGGGGGGELLGGGGGGATSGTCFGAGGGGGGGGRSSFVQLGNGLQLVQPFDASGFRAQFNTIGLVIITPIFD